VTVGGVARTATCLHELFEAQADLRPSAPALIDGAAIVSFKELEEKSNRLARYLRSCGVAPGTLVGLYFERSARPFVAMLGVLKAGAGYVPIDSAYPAERVRHILADAGVGLLLTEQALGEQASSAFEGRIVLLDAHWPEIAEQPADRLSPEECGAQPGDLCYVIYTSGTTGRPKGVMIEHQSALSFLSAFNEICQIGYEDRVYQGFSLGFDGSVEETWMAFSTGATLVVGTREAARSGRDIARLLNEREVTVFSTVPTLLSMIEEELPTVRLLIVSGEQCQPHLVSRWAVPGRRMLNVYGPTEATVNTTAAECAPGKAITIGRPLCGYETHVLDDGLRPVPPGEPGELCIGGVCLARGYLNQPELTAERFVPNPLDGPADGSPRLYRTGDLVRMTETGDLEFLGRIDNQVKIRGFRIELSEIEAVLLEHGMIRAAAVNVLDRNGVQHLAAYVIPNDGVEAFDRDGVLDLLRTRLPDYMIPAYLDLVAELPTLTSGKVDRKRLPAPNSPLVRTGRQIVAPGTDLERRIAAVWEGIFEVAPVSVEDDFFRDLGGHSLLAARMVSVLRNELQRDVAIRDVYQYPTIRRLAEHLASSPQPTPAIAAEERRGPSAQSSRAVLESLPWFTRPCCLALQVASIYLIYGVAAAPGVAFLLLYIAVQGGGLSPASAIYVGVAVTLSLYPTMLASSIVVKWVVIGRYKPGSYPVWGLYYFRWWLVTRWQSLAGPGLLAGTPLLSVYYRLMGAKVGSNCTLDTPHCSIFDLVTIGDDTRICSDIESRTGC
jgi:amino acid adenylation domain-containing protein